LISIYFFFFSFQQRLALRTLVVADDLLRTRHYLIRQRESAGACFYPCKESGEKKPRRLAYRDKVEEREAEDVIYFVNLLAARGVLHGREVGGAKWVGLLDLGTNDVSRALVRNRGLTFRARSQGTITEGEGSVWLTSTLRQIGTRRQMYIFSFKNR